MMRDVSHAFFVSAVRTDNALRTRPDIARIMIVLDSGLGVKGNREYSAVRGNSTLRTVNVPTFGPWCIVNLKFIRSFAVWEEKS